MTVAGCIIFAAFLVVVGMIWWLLFRATLRKPNDGNEFADADDYSSKWGP